MRTAKAMTWEQHEALGSEARGEHVNGAFVPMDQPRKVHQRIARRLANMLEGAISPRHEVLERWGWKSADDEFALHVTVVPADLARPPR